MSQEPDLFADTLEYNIMYGDPNANLHPFDPANPPATAKSATEVAPEVLEAAQVRCSPQRQVVTCFCKFMNVTVLAAF